MAPVRIIWQHVAVQEHHVLADHTQGTPPTVKTQKTYTVDYADTGKGIVSMPKGLQLLPTKHTPYPFT